MKPREDLKQHIPRLRRYARALGCHSPESPVTSDDLVHTALLETIEKRIAVRGDLSIHLFRALIQLHREALHSGKICARSTPERSPGFRGVLEEGSKTGSARISEDTASPGHFTSDYTTPSQSLLPSLAPRLGIPRHELEPSGPRQPLTGTGATGTRLSGINSQAKPNSAIHGSGTSENRVHFETQRERAVTALKNLKLDEKEAYLLVVLEGFDYATASKILRISKAALVDRLMQARLALGSANFLTPKLKTRSVPHLVLVK